MRYLAQPWILDLSPMRDLQEVAEKTEVRSQILCVLFSLMLETVIGWEFA
jgi:hypothetical protein